MNSKTAFGKIRAASTTDIDQIHRTVTHATNIIETFTQAGDFRAMDAAESWCRERGISFGRNCRGLPRGLMYGDYDIQKWRNLNAKEIAQLDGRMTGDMRSGPVRIEICQPPVFISAAIAAATNNQGA